MNSKGRQALLDHYDRTKRDLPWRGETDPYRILVSEIMLQQTRVDTVLGYYEPWLERFPDAEALASAEMDDVLKAWEGLGYYRRARSLHAAASVVREQGGRFPDSSDALRALPGVGEYTAGAVASIAFGEAVPAVDGNVRRVFARWYDEAAPTPAWLRDRAAGLVDPERPGDWNQALMELGATVCTPKRPKCDACPVARWCAALASGTVDERPVPAKRTKVRRADFVVAVVEAGGRFLLQRRPESGLLSGMWAFPEREVDVSTVASSDASGEALGEATGEAAAAVGAEAAKAVVAALGVGVPRACRPLSEVRHLFSHIDATYQPWLLSVPDVVDVEGGVWVDSDESTSYALPVAQRTIMENAVAELS